MKKKKTYGYSTKDKYIEFELTIKVSTEMKFYFGRDELPEHLLGDNHMVSQREYFDSFYELDRRILDLCEEAELKFIDDVKTRVILYLINVYETRLSLAYAVVDKVEKAGRHSSVTYYELEKDRMGRKSSHNEYNVEHHIGSDYSEMPWTQEREHWFETISGQIESLGKQLLRGFGKRSEILARKIDQGILLLNGSER